MLQTIEAIYDPQQGLAFSEAVDIKEPVRVLVTFVAPCRSVTPDKGSSHALLAALRAHPLPESVRLSDADIEAQIREISEGWE
ncbi:MAG: hypothetical protein WCP34_15660 [Pseudomonadota bacterium]